MGGDTGCSVGLGLEAVGIFAGSVGIVDSQSWKSPEGKAGLIFFWLLSNPNTRSVRTIILLNVLHTFLLQVPHFPFASYWEPSTLLLQCPLLLVLLLLPDFFSVMYISNRSRHQVLQTHTFFGFGGVTWLCTCTCASSSSIPSDSLLGGM